MVAVARRLGDLPLDPPLLQLKQAHAQHRLVGRRPFLCRECDVCDESAKRGVVFGQICERILEVRDKMVAGTPKEIRGELVIRQTGKVAMTERSARQ